MKLRGVTVCRQLRAALAAHPQNLTVSSPGLSKRVDGHSPSLSRIFFRHTAVRSSSVPGESWRGQHRNGWKAGEQEIGGRDRLRICGERRARTLENQLWLHTPTFKVVSLTYLD